MSGVLSYKIACHSRGQRIGRASQLVVQSVPASAVSAGSGLAQQSMRRERIPALSMLALKRIAQLEVRRNDTKKLHAASFRSTPGGRTGLRGSEIRSRVRFAAKELGIFKLQGVGEIIEMHGEICNTHNTMLQ